MALIMHRCAKCGHPDYFGSTVTDTGKRMCVCGCSCRPGKSEVAPTFDQTGARVERIAAPGQRLTDTTNVIPCGCKDCQALHAEFTTI
jgi:hypothetical protein